MPEREDWNLWEEGAEEEWEEGEEEEEEEVEEEEEEVEEEEEEEEEEGLYLRIETRKRVQTNGRKECRLRMNYFSG